jgi:cytochrome c553
MNISRTSMCVAAVATVMGCTHLERSRSLSDPLTPAKTIALQVCSNCHGVAGNASSPNFPNLAAQRPEYVVEQLTLFRGHGRLDPAGFEYMWGLSRSLSDEQIQGLAEYYGAQTSITPSAAPGSLVAEGKQIFETGLPDKHVPACAACHGDHGQGIAKTPRLANQHADYVLKQLTVFQRTDQRPEGAVMKVIAHDMTLQNMEAVAAYVQSGAGH